MDTTKIVNKLTDSQLNILRDGGTETPFSGEHLYSDDDGMYCCAACGRKLFSSHSKFDAHCGWPSFYDVIDSDSIELKEDRSHGMRRIEAVCGNCGGHLGHVFNDALDQPTGLRYCINSLSLDFIPDR
jgi:peptide-methionine (R)-S-oxide reductase